MTGDQCILVVELAVLRVRDRLKHDSRLNVHEAFDLLAREIAEIGKGYRSAIKEDQSSC